jgi:hypothetical protein
VARLRDAKGLRHLAQLLAHPGREFHVIDLEAADRQAAPVAVPSSRSGIGEPQLTVRLDLGDAGFQLDAAAKAAYRAESRNCARSWMRLMHSTALPARPRYEPSWTFGGTACTRSGVGRPRPPSCIPRRTGSVERNQGHPRGDGQSGGRHPSLGRHLAATIRTGRYCSYTPDSHAPIKWER